MPDLDDDLANRLERLAPTVDPIASRAVFERSRVRSATPRWLLPAAVVVLLIAGVVGLWAVAGDDDAPVQPADEAPITEGSATEGNGYETLLVAEASAPFGSAMLATTTGEYDAAWERFVGDGDAPDLDLTRNVALVMTRPDNACADTIVRFDIEPIEGTPTWTPLFEDLSNECEDPLLSWLYVVAIDRAALGPAAVIRVPAAEIYDVPEVLLRYESSGVAPADTEPDEFRLTETGIRLPLPPVGEPALHSTSAGLLWVVAHVGDDVSVLPGTFPQAADEDEGGVTSLHALVRASASGRTFASGGLLWDDHGRAISGGRANDLVGFEGRVVDGEVEVLDSGATRIDGSPSAPVVNEEYLLPELPPVIDLPTFMTLSSSGPIWRHLDATLVVQDGIGRICDIPTAVAVPDLPTCDDAEFVLDTAIASSQPEITSWFHAPVLAFQDPTRGFTTVVPLGGMSSRNEAAFDDPVAVVNGMRFRCDERAGLVMQVDLEIAGSGSAELVVIDGDTELGTTVTSGSDAWTVGFALNAEPGPGAQLLVSSSWSDVSLDLPTDVPACTGATTDGPPELIAFIEGLPPSGTSPEWIVDETRYLEVVEHLAGEAGVDLPSSVDLDVPVLVVPVAGSPCTTFDGLSRTGDTIDVEFGSSADLCNAMLIEWTALVAVDPPPTGDTVTVRAPAEMGGPLVTTVFDVASGAMLSSG